MKETDFLMVSLSPPEGCCIIEETLKCQGGGLRAVEVGGGGGEERAAASRSSRSRSSDENIIKHSAAWRQITDLSFP